MASEGKRGLQEIKAPYRIVTCATIEVAENLSSFSPGLHVTITETGRPQHDFQMCLARITEEMIISTEDMMSGTLATLAKVIATRREDNTVYITIESASTVAQGELVKQIMNHTREGILRGGPFAKRRVPAGILRAPTGMTRIH